MGRGEEEEETEGTMEKDKEKGDRTRRQAGQEKPLKGDQGKKTGYRRRRKERYAIQERSKEQEEVKKRLKL